MEALSKKSRDPFVLALGGATVTASIYMIYVLFGYVSVDGYFDHIEPNVTIAAWRLLDGVPLYQSYDEWPLFGNYYGPMIYLTHAASLAVTNGAMWGSKIITSMAPLASVIIFYLYARRRFETSIVYFGVLSFIAFFFLSGMYGFWNRPDPLSILLVTIAIYVKDHVDGRFARWLPRLVIGACIGLAVNLRAHSFIFFLPIMVDFCGWKNIREMTIIVIASVIVFLMPFALPGVSLVNFITGLFGQVSEKGFDLVIFKVVIRYSLFYVSPGLLLLGLYVRARQNIVAKDAIYFAVMSGCLALLLFPASFVGAGIYHFLPLFPITVELLMRFAVGFKGMPKAQKTILALIPIILIVISIPVQKRLKRNMDRLAAETVGAEVRAIAKKYSDGPVQMGYGHSYEGYRYSFYKPVLALAGQPVTLDAQVIMEIRYLGLDVVPKIAKDFSTCKTRHWLIPKGEEPFSMPSYSDGISLFGDATNVFKNHYAKTASFQYFDVWSCK